MPEMDGLEATRQIRGIDFEGERPWIVALTANAMQEDRKLCLAAGMDDFVSKPIQAKDLRRALLSVPDRMQAPVAEPVPESENLAIPEYLTEMLSEDADAATELIQMFLDDTTASLEKLDEALAAGVPDRVSRLLHSLKGSCGQMGAVKIARISKNWSGARARANSTRPGFAWRRSGKSLPVSQGSWPGCCPHGGRPESASGSPADLRCRHGWGGTIAAVVA